MNRLLTYIIYLTATLLTVGALSSCEDRFEYPGYEDIPEGISSVDMTFSFPDYTPALESRASGTALRKIRTLWIAIYQDGGQNDGLLLDKLEIKNFMATDAPRPDTSESYTGSATFKMTYQNGRYRIYAIANHDITDSDISTEEKLFTLPLTWTDTNNVGIERNDQMFGWFRNDTEEPDFHRTPTSVIIKPGMTNLHAWVRRAASKVTVAFNTTRLNENVSIYLHSVSVVDIPKQCYLHKDNNLGEDDYALENAFAPKGPSSTIYFKGAKAGDDPKNDHLKWPYIMAGDLVFGLYADEKGKHDVVIDDIELGGTTPADDDEYAKKYQAALTQRINSITAVEHAEITRALYFFENMQAPGQLGTPSDKRQIVGAVEDTPQSGNVTSYPDGTYGGSHNEDGTLVEGAYDKNGWKDARPWGTYIEVKGYYESGTGKGPITYRFMLGKDVLTNYEAERNHHYKLTLVFNGAANDVDFHIDYEEEAKPGLFAPTEAYVPYLYNQRSGTTLRATPKPGYEMIGLKAVIVDNEWRPHDASGVYYWEQAWKYQGGKVDGVIGKRQRVDGTGKSYDPADTKGQKYEYTYEKDDPEAANNVEFGFLALWRMRAVTRNAGGKATDVTKTEMVKNFYDFYFKYDTYSEGIHSLGLREYEISQTLGVEVEHSDTYAGRYTTKLIKNPVNGELDYIIDIPLFTRAKTFDPWAVYSGANPFYEHYRYARVKFTATYRKKGGTDEYQDVAYTNVYQARRIDNPRGIYRSRDNMASFHVNLKYLKLNATDDDAFEPVISRGPWTATIETDPNGLIQISANGQVARGQGNSITGRSGSEIDFVYKPLKHATTTESYGGIITVTYHNNSCVHKIIVRQGYCASTIGEGKTKFSAFNVYNKSELVKNPLSVGSLFRCYSNIDQPIAESNNSRLSEGFGVGSNPTAGYIILGQTTKTVWSSLNTWKNWGNYDPFYTHTNGANSFTLNNTTDGSGEYKLPTYENTLELGLVPIGADENEDNDINFAFGITYGDGATETLSTSGAWSFTDPDNDGKRREEGVRGLIIYSKAKGDNLMLPFGATGHGRRRCKDAMANNAAYNGYMRYGDLDKTMDQYSGTTNYFRPMAWNLVNQYGASYWISTGTTADFNKVNNLDPTLSQDEGYVVAFDINYGNYMVARGRSKQYNKSGTGWDALPMRLVKVK